MLQLGQGEVIAACCLRAGPLEHTDLSLKDLFGLATFTHLMPYSLSVPQAEQHALFELFQRVPDAFDVYH